MKQWRAIGTLLPLIAVCALVVPTLVPLAPWKTGLGPRLLSVWGLLLLFVASSLSIGMATVRALTRGPGRDGRWALAFATGAIIFGTGLGFTGWLNLWGPRFFFCYPLLLLGLGLHGFLTEWLTRPPVLSLKLSWVELLALGLGVICVALLGLQVIDPNNVNFDAAWYHLRVGQRYALAGGLVRAVEGDQLFTLPQTASWLYGWCFLSPLLTVDDKVIFCLHLELVMILGTLAVIPALARQLIPGLDRDATQLSWVALFFFPCLFIYDTGLMGGADHFVSMWAAAVLLLWFQTRERGDLRSWILFGVLIAGLLAKYSSLYLIVPLAPAIAFDWFQNRAKHRWSPVAALGVALALVSPYWLRNWLWYGNPVYPELPTVFTNRPWNPDAPAWKLWYKLANDFTPKGDFVHRAAETLQALAGYPVQYNTWSDMTGGQPIAGFAYALSVVALPFVVPKKRLVLWAVMLHVAIAVWFNTHQHHMRYLAVMLPAMAAAVAAVAIHVWREHGTIGRLSVSAMVVVHLIAFGDLPFRHTHRMNRRNSPVENGANYIAERGAVRTQHDFWKELGDSLPPNAKPLVHGVWPHLGLERQSVTDFTILQFGVNYAHWGSLPEIWTQLRSMGVTHVIWADAVTSFDSVGGEALFHAFALRTENRRRFGAYWVGELPAVPPAPSPEGVVYLGCGNKQLYASGLYRVKDLGGPTPPIDYPWPTPKPTEVNADWAQLLTRASWVVQETDCGLAAPPMEFVRAAEQVDLPKRLVYFVKPAGAAWQ